MEGPLGAAISPVHTPVLPSLMICEDSYLRYPLFMAGCRWVCGFLCSLSLWASSPHCYPALLSKCQAGIGTVGLPRAVTLAGGRRRAGKAVTLPQANVEVLMNMNGCLLLRRASPIRFLHTSASPERLLGIKCKSHIYWYESAHSITFSPRRI